MSYTPYAEQLFQTRYSLTEAPAATIGYVLHTITCQYSTDGSEWTDDRQMRVVVPAAALEAVLVLADGAAKVQAYKDLLKEHRNTEVEINNGSADEAIQERANGLARATAAAAGAAAYIATVKPDYPVNFTL